jgi:hypothetical protein
MQSADHAAMGHQAQSNDLQNAESDSERNALHPHGLYIASLLLSAYAEFLENRRARALDAPRNPSYNRDDKNICTGDENGTLG